MEKFKIGDKVRCIDSKGTYSLGWGNEYFVKEFDSYGRVIVNGSICSWHPDRFELVEEKQTEEAVSENTNKFKVGDKVRCINITNSIGLTHGVVYVVQGVNKNNFIRVSLGELYWNPDKFELVEVELEEVNMTGFKRFGDMTLEEKEELISAYLRGEEILYSTNETGDAKVLGTYASKGTVLFTHLHYYKIKKEELDIPWEYIDSKYKYAVKGMGDIVLVSTHKPIYDKLTEYWSVPEGSLRNLPEPFTIKNLDKIKPEESLVERPSDE